MHQGTGSPIYQLFMLALCLLALAGLGLEHAITLDEQSRIVLEYADMVICGVFLVDFFLSLWRAPDRWRYFRTWGWLDLISSLPAFTLARWGRFARIARIVRVLRAIRATRILGQLVLTRRAESAFLAVSLLALLLIVTSSLAILQFEIVGDSNIRTAEEALWWSITTVTTVGYGDRFPVTTEGRLVAVVLMGAGVGLVGTFSGLLAAWFVKPSSREEVRDIDALRGEVRELRLALEQFMSSPKLVRGGAPEEQP